MQKWPSSPEALRASARPGRRYRRRGWAVVANARTITLSQDPEVAAVDGDVSEQATAERIVGAALGRFGRVDTLVNNAGVFISKPFTDYTADDYAVMVGVNLTGFFWLTQRVIAEMLAKAAATSSTSARRSPTTRSPAHPRS